MLNRNLLQFKNISVPGLIPWHYYWSPANYSPPPVDLKWFYYLDHSKNAWLIDWLIERQTAGTWAAHGLWQHRGREQCPRWQRECRAPGRRGSRPCPQADSSRAITAVSSPRSAEVCTHSSRRWCFMGYMSALTYYLLMCGLHLSIVAVSDGQKYTEKKSGRHLSSTLQESSYKCLSYMTNAELLHWLVETPSRDIHHYRVLNRVSGRRFNSQKYWTVTWLQYWTVTLTLIS